MVVWPSGNSTQMLVKYSHKTLRQSLFLTAIVKSSTVFARFTCPGILNNSSVNLRSNRVYRALGPNIALKKSRIRLFWALKWSKMTPQNGQYFWDHLSTFSAENTPNNSKTTLKKSRIRLFRPPKWSKMTPQNGQNEQIFDRKFQFSGSFMNLQSWKSNQK